MAEENGKAERQRQPTVAPAESEATRKRPGLEKYALPGPWTEDHERFFQIMIREFGGGHDDRDPHL
jgi:hypothetical protein